MPSKKKIALAAAVAAAVMAPSAFATNGYFAHGYGAKAQGMGGAGVALSQDALAAATNPAGMAIVGNRTDIGVALFMPNRNTEVAGNAAAANNIKYDANDEDTYFVPEFGYNRMLGQDMSFGVSVFGNGGMNTSYTRNITLFSSDTGVKAGVDLSQLFVAPTLGWKLGDNQAIGVSLNLAYQRFAASGLHNFDVAAQSSNPGYVTNKGYDTSTGYGFRVGWTGNVSQTVTLGATYQTKTNMSKFESYKGLFAEQGDFDIPANAAVGIAVKPAAKTAIAFDIEKIWYSKVAAVGNPLGPVSGAGVLQNTLGTNNGAGFGWQDITVYKLGVSHEISGTVALRAGWNHGEQPIPSSQTFFNLLAPGVIEDHLTMGATWKLGKAEELSVMFMHAFNNEVKGSGSIPTGFGGGEANLEMDQNSFGLAYGWSF